MSFAVALPTLPIRHPPICSKAAPMLSKSSASRYHIPVACPLPDTLFPNGRVAVRERLGLVAGEMLGQMQRGVAPVTGAVGRAADHPIR